jgi:GNAT superfamily N-acetyltransferase
MRIAFAFSPQERAAMPATPALPRFDANKLTDHVVNAHICALSSGGDVLAYCSLWWKEAPTLRGQKVGAIGHYASADGDAAAALLDEAVGRLRQEGCTHAVGPMDGNTWRSYRFVTNASSVGAPESPFFLEPVNPPDWPLQFEHAGFEPIANYFSALNDDLTRSDGRIDRIVHRLQGAGVRIYSALKANLRDELGRIYQVSRIAFTRNFLYTELPERAFVAQYLPLLDRIEPELVLLARRGGQLVGYLFAIPDFAQAARGEAIDTFLIKTVAILPEPSLRGLGTVLVARAHEVGNKLGYRRCIHALMHEDNVSRNISNHYAKTIRRYTLYGREIAP